MHCNYVTDMRRDVQEIFRSTPHSKQVMMFSATLSKEIRPVCKKFMQDVITQSSSSLQSTIASTALVPYLYPGQNSAHTKSHSRRIRGLGDLNATSKRPKYRIWEWISFDIFRKRRTIICSTLVTSIMSPSKSKLFYVCVLINICVHTYIYIYLHIYIYLYIYGRQEFVFNWFFSHKMAQTKDPI